MVNTYAKRTGQKAEDIAQWMADETWMGAQDSVDRGFADRIDTGTKAQSSWDMSAYANAPAIPKARTIETRRPAHRSTRTAARSTGGERFSRI